MRLGSTRRHVLGGLAGSAALGLAGAPLAAPSGAPVRVGSTLSLTGPLAQTAQIYKIVGEIYLEGLNQRNGLNGRPVEWVLLDDQSKPEITRSLYEKLITVDKVDLIIGPYGTATILAAFGVAQRYNKMIIQSSMGIPKLATYEMQIPATPFGSEWNKSFPNGLFDALATTAHPPKSIVILSSKFPSAQFMAEGTQEVAKARGLNVLLYLEYEFGTRDFGAIAARVKDANPDLLWVGALGVEGNQLLEALKKLDYVPPRHFYLYPAPGPLAVSPDARNALSGTFFEPHLPFTAKPEYARFAEAFAERAQKAGLPYPHADAQAAGGYSTWQLLDQACNGAKSLDDKTLVQFLKQHGAETILGKLRFDGPFNHGDTFFALKQVQDGKWVTVWPAAYAAPGAKLIAP